MGKTYFASDFHLGSPDYESSMIREKRIVQWLEMIRADAEHLFLVGDIFDFWFEYKKVIPRNYTRFLGKLSELSDAGVKIYFFKGNHDMWTFGYLEQEIGVELISDEWTGEIHGKKYFVHHGDALGPGDARYKFIRRVFRSNWATWLFHRFHPNFGIALAQYLSGKSRKKNEEKDALETDLNGEFQYRFALKKLEESPIDYFIFGHRHFPRQVSIDNKAQFINLGDWIQHFTYAEADDNTLELKVFDPGSFPVQQ